MAQGQQDNVDSNIRLLYTAVVIVVLTLLVWFFAHDAVVRGIFFLRKIEIQSIFAVLNPISRLLSFLHLPSFQLNNLQDWQAYLNNQALSISAVDLSTIGDLSGVVGRYLCLPFAVILIGLGLFLRFKHKSIRFSHIYDMKALRKSEVENWPQITPIVKLDLVKQDITEGPWAMAMTPLDFGKKHQLIHPKKEKGLTVWGLDQGAAARELTMQLGSRWNDTGKLPIHVKALVVAFVACANKKRDVANEIFQQVGRSAHHKGQLDFTGVEELFEKYQKNSVVKWATQKHAYVLTAMATLLQMARTDGVVATADFLWLKPVDRKLWYMLNTVGRQTVVPEVAGPYAHWLAEKRVGRRLVAPMIKEAVKGLDVAVQETLYVAEGDEWQIDAD